MLHALQGLQIWFFWGFFFRMTHAPYFFHERAMISVHEMLIAVLLAKPKTVTASEATEACCWQRDVDTVFMSRVLDIFSIILDIIEMPHRPEICQICSRRVILRK